ncbi:MAG: hypothetical protein H9791_10480 [Candidatus Bacteroides intestinipullorum]|uniref:Uncharacterized protein n=1 Tax=Candidatus Bacteroides intestinipullorum TaxID=2838471 RepID=A0A9E2KIP5_9BACE|nr:hypothetical protein [Candidatus Bacteroides intestinipullorum]
MKFLVVFTMNIYPSQSSGCVQRVNSGRKYSNLCWYVFHFPLKKVAWGILLPEKERRVRQNVVTLHAQIAVDN